MIRVVMATRLRLQLCALALLGVAGASVASRVRIQVAQGRMLQPARGESVLAPVSRLCAQHLFVQKPATPAAEQALSSTLYDNLVSRYSRANAKKNALVVACDEDGVVLGTCGVTLEKQPLVTVGDVPVLANLVVDPSLRGRGVGRSLVAKVEDIVRGWGEKRLYLKVEEANEPAIRLYKRLGYRVTLVEQESEIPIATAGPFGAGVRWMPAPLVVMEKDLGAFNLPYFLL